MLHINSRSTNVVDLDFIEMLLDHFSAKHSSNQ